MTAISPLATRVISRYFGLERQSADASATFLYPLHGPTLITFGSLLTRGSLAEPITATPEWGEIDVADLRADRA